MPWRQRPKKDVVGCDKPRGAVSRRYIRGFPNGVTHSETCLEDLRVEFIDAREGTGGTETSQYLEEKRSFP